MAKTQLECPSCGAAINLGDIMCSQCGVNLKSGEAFETRVQKAKGKSTHPEHFSGRIYGSVVVAFAICSFSMFMYHRDVAKSMTEVPDYYVYPVKTMSNADDLVAMGNAAMAAGDGPKASAHYKEAQTSLTALIGWLQAEADKLDPAKQAKRRIGRQTVKKFKKRLARRQMNNMRLKAEFKLSRVPG